MSADANKESFTLEEVAERFGVSVRTVKRWRAAGELTGFKRGGIVRFYADDIAAFEAKNSTGAHPPGERELRNKLAALEQRLANLEKELPQLRALAA